jgi:hypothetical protein
MEKSFLIPDANVDEVVEVCHRVLKEMGLKIMKTETAKEGKTTVLAGERAIVPLLVRALSFPFSLGEYIKAAQRSGVHVVVSQGQDGVRLFSCGIALDELSGKEAKYTKEEMIEEVTDTMEAWDFEGKFINRMKAAFPQMKEIG